MVKQITYNEFKNKIINKESFIFYFGGDWCKNCTPVIPLINEVAKNNNIKVYNLDPKDKEEDFRKCLNTKDELKYKEFIQLLGYQHEETVLIDTEFRDSNIPRLSVPAVFAIKDGNISYELIEEYLELTKEQEDFYKKELQTLINTHH
ncbi:MAG: thioredoxin domain-containing protein [bacterium]